MRSAFFFALVLTLSATAARAEIKVGDVFPALATAGLTGGTVPATEGKILVVDFWASWCAPCKASFPALGKINTDYTPRGVVLVGVSVDEKASAYAAFVKKQAPPFPALHDVAQQLVRAVVVPATVKSAPFTPVTTAPPPTNSSAPNSTPCSPRNPK